MKTVPILPRLIRPGSRPTLGAYRSPPPVPPRVIDQGGRSWPALNLAVPNADGEPCGDHCLPFGTPDGPMRWLNEPAREKRAPRPPVAPPRAPVALRGYRAWSCPPLAGRPAISSPLYGTPCVPPGMGQLQRWTCPNGDSVLIRAGRGMAGCGPCGGLAGLGCGGSCDCKGCSKGMGSVDPDLEACPGGFCATGSIAAPAGAAYSPDQWDRDLGRGGRSDAMAAFSRLDRAQPEAYETPTTTVGPGAMTGRGYVEAAPAAARSSGGGGTSFWQGLLDELSGSKGQSLSRTMADSYASAFRAASFTVPNIQSATDDIEQMTAAAARASSVYDTAAQRAYATLSQSSRPLALQPELFRLPARAPLIGPFGEQPKASGGMTQVAVVAGVGVALVLGFKAWKKRKGAGK